MSSTLRLVVLVAGVIGLVGVVGWAWRGQGDHLLAVQLAVAIGCALALGYWR